MDGVETRFGVANSAVFADATTLTSTGAVNSFHDSYTSLGGLMALFNMQLGGRARRYRLRPLRHAHSCGHHGVRGRSDGRAHPGIPGKKITPREIKLAASYFLVTPLLMLIGTSLAMALPGQRVGILNSGPHGLSEVLYAFTFAANNNGSAFAGISVNTVWYNTALGLAMVLGRFLPMILVLALAGSLARQGKTPESVGTLPTHRLQFVGMVVGVTVILVLTLFGGLRG